ncbi:hypothetical protein [Vibrio anguillarum]|uniref:Uncharacterized protein n=1 Tax=Vibrio anguillarum TaxID=55601 RepID=A0ABR9Z7D1_VIBAN|nr:hypothetical protein [Vibrio anguillarum]MBF4374353.1 hypothetical protein [Vibrio anguillarum]
MPSFMITILKAIVFAITVPIVFVGFVYTGFIRRGIWAVFRVFSMTFMLAINAITSQKNVSLGKTFVAIVVTVFLLYQTSFKLPYVHYLQYMETMNQQFEDVFVHRYDDDNEYRSLTFTENQLFKIQFSEDPKATMLPFYKPDTEDWRELSKDTDYQTKFYFWVQEMEFGRNLIPLPKLVYVVFILYGLWTAVCSKVFDWFLFGLFYRRPQ